MPLEYPSAADGRESLVASIAFGLDRINALSGTGFSLGGSPSASEGIETLLAKVALSVLGLTRNGSYSFPLIVNPPTAVNWGTDSSMFPNGVFPASGVYKAYSATFEYTYVGGKGTGWSRIARPFQT